MFHNRNSVKIYHHILLSFAYISISTKINSECFINNIICIIVWW
nr:MAG TPA: hypothetical protein [Caudoviricetes sp.]